MNVKPPRWADRFLEWYCRPELLEEIQGDAYELFYRKAKTNSRRANLLFAWNVLRFFRWKNIRRSEQRQASQIPLAMIKNILLVSVRHFVRQPGHSLVNVTGLAVAFTCAFLILFWTSFEFSFDRFHSDSEQIYKVITHVEADGNIQTYQVASAALDVSSIPEVDKLVSVSAGKRWPNVLCLKPEDNGQDCTYFNGVYANQNLFSVFNFPIISGDVNPLSEPKHIAISENMAHLLFGSEDPIGKTLKVDGWQQVVVASVFKNIPANSSLQFDFALPFSVLKELWGVNEQRFSENFFNTYLKTQKEASSAKLTEKLNDVRVLTEKAKREKVSYEAIPMTDTRLKSKFENGKQSGGRIDYVFLFAVIGCLIVVMAAINFINMTIARAFTRAKEIGVRKVTGAYRSSIIFQFVGESFLIVVTSFLLALVFAKFALPAFNSILGEQISISLLDGRVAIYLLGILIVISLLASLYPAFVLSSFQPVKVLKNQFVSKFTGSQRLRKLLLVVQLSVSIGIIIFSGVLFLQLKYVNEKSLGFDRSNMIRLEPTANLFRSFDSFKNELLRNSSITSVACSANNPLNTPSGNTGVSWPGKPKDLRVTFKTIACTYEFAETFGLKIIQGRDLQSQSRDTLNTEVLVTEEAVKIMGLKQTIGEIITIGDAPCVIVGVINDFHTESLHESRLPVILYRANYNQTSAIYVKYQAGTTQQSLEALTQAYKKFENNFGMRYWFQDDTFNEIYKTEITVSRLVLIFTLVALVIAAIGIVGLATYNVHRKTKEIGIRRVFGASISQMMALLSNEFGVILLVAIVCAIPTAWYTSNSWLNGFAYRIDMPWWLYASTFFSIAVLTIGIICVQGLKTATTNPTKILRSE